MSLRESLQNLAAVYGAQDPQLAGAVNRVCAYLPPDAAGVEVVSTPDPDPVEAGEAEAEVYEDDDC